MKFIKLIALGLLLSFAANSFAGVSPLSTVPVHKSVSYAMVSGGKEKREKRKETRDARKKVRAEKKAQKDSKAKTNGAKPSN